MDYLTRKVTIDDYDAIYELWNAAEQSRRALNPVDDSREGIARYLKRNPDTCFAAEKDGKIIGVILTGHDGRRAIIHHMCVHPDYRRMGIAGHLVSLAEDALKKESAKKADKIMRKYRAKEHEARREYYERIFIPPLPPAWLSETYTCKCCSREYKPIETGYNSKKYCSERCQKRLYDRKKDVKRDHRKRWRKHDKGITLDALYARDNGICYLCGKPCDYSDMSINDGVFIAGNMYPSIDHVKPLARGGTHTWDNVKLAHRICNSIKSDREGVTDDTDETNISDRGTSRQKREGTASQRREKDADRRGDGGGCRYRIRPRSA